MEMHLEKEVRFHLEEHTADLIAHGVDPEEARRQARLTFGGPEQVKENCRDARGTRWLEDLLQDVLHVRYWGPAGDDQAKVRAQLYYPFAQVPDTLVERRL